MTDPTLQEALMDRYTANTITPSIAGWQALAEDVIAALADAPEPLDVERLARAIGVTNRSGWKNGISPLTYGKWAASIAAEYERLTPDAPDTGAVVRVPLRYVRRDGSISTGAHTPSCPENHAPGIACPVAT